MPHHKNILVKRNMALGDCLCVTPVLRRLRQETEGSLFLAVETGYPIIFQNNVDVDRVNVQRTWDQVIDLNMAHERRRDIHAIEAYMEVAFGDPGWDHDKSIFFDYVEAAPSEGKVAALHPNASWTNRTLPNAWWDTVAEGLRNAGFEVLVLGTGKDYCPTGPVTDTRDKLDLRQQASAIASASVFICGASGLFILAAATKTPVVVPLTINTPRTALPWRDGIQGGGYFPVVPDIECIGCSERAGPVTFLGCERDDYACIGLIDPVQTINLAIAVTI